jgi:CHAT domain-containing protein
LSGLARAFFFAGAKGLLVSQWSVDDRATQALMTEIFTRYGKDQLTPAAALRQGMLAIMSEGARNPKEAYFAHPFAWAAFFLVGEGR